MDLLLVQAYIGPSGRTGRVSGFLFYLQIKAAVMVAVAAVFFMLLLPKLG